MENVCNTQSQSSQAFEATQSANPIDTSAPWFHVLQKVVEKGYYTENAVQDVLERENYDEIIGQMLQEVSAVDDEIYGMCCQVFTPVEISAAVDTPLPSQAIEGTQQRSQAPKSDVDDKTVAPEDNVGKETRIPSQKVKNTNAEKENKGMGRQVGNGKAEKGEGNILKDNRNIVEYGREPTKKPIEDKISNLEEINGEPETGDGDKMDEMDATFSSLQSMTQEFEEFRKVREMMMRQMMQNANKCFTQIVNEMLLLVKEMEGNVKFAIIQQGVREAAKEKMMKQIETAISKLK